MTPLIIETYIDLLQFIWQEYRIKRRDNSSFSQWHNLATDLLILVINRLNYEDCIHVRAVCKGWRAIHKSTCATVLAIPLQGISAILIILGKDSFKDLFNFFICWIKGQNDRTIKALLDLTPLQEIYHWGYSRNRPDESMFTYFMTMAQRLGNKDAEFYWASKSIIFRNRVNHDIFDYSYQIIKSLSMKGHTISVLFKNMLDIYFFPKKKKTAVIIPINLITSPETRGKIFGMMVALNTIAEEIYLEITFGPLEGTPICMCPYPSEDNR